MVVSGRFGSLWPHFALCAVHAFRSSGVGECDILLHYIAPHAPAPMHQVGGRRIDRLSSRAAPCLDSGAFGAIISRDSPSIASAPHNWPRQMRCPCPPHRRACACTRALGRVALGRSLSGRYASISRVFGRFGGISPPAPCVRLAYLAAADAISFSAVSLSMRLHASARSSCTLSRRYRAGRLVVSVVSVVLASPRPLHRARVSHFWRR